MITSLTSLQSCCRFSTLTPDAVVNSNGVKCNDIAAYAFFFFFPSLLFFFLPQLVHPTVPSKNCFKRTRLVYSSSAPGPIGFRSIYKTLRPLSFCPLIFFLNLQYHVCHRAHATVVYSGIVGQHCTATVYVLHAPRHAKRVLWYFRNLASKSKLAVLLLTSFQQPLNTKLQRILLTLRQIQVPILELPRQTPTGCWKQ